MKMHGWGTRVMVSKRIGSYFSSDAVGGLTIPVNESYPCTSGRQMTAKRCMNHNPSEKLPDYIH